MVVHTLTGHTQDVKAVKCLGASHVVSVCKDGSVALWDTKLGCRVGWHKTQRMQYTDCAVAYAGPGDRENIRLVLTSFYGSLTFATCSLSKLREASRAKETSIDIDGAGGCASGNDNPKLQPKKFEVGDDNDMLSVELVTASYAEIGDGESAPPEES